MAIETVYAHIEKPANDTARLKRLPRIRVAMIVAPYLAWGMSPEEMARQYPHLTLSEIHSAMAYYHDHCDEIDAELAAEPAEYEQGHAAQQSDPLFQRLRALKSLKRN